MRRTLHGEARIVMVVVCPLLVSAVASGNCMNEGLPILSVTGPGAQACNEHETITKSLHAIYKRLCQASTVRWVQEVRPLDGSPEAAHTAAVVAEVSAVIRQALKGHPVNVQRISEGKNPANLVLLRGCGSRCARHSGPGCCVRFLRFLTYIFHTMTHCPIQKGLSTSLSDMPVK